MNAGVTLVLGGARSGKSRYAERLAEAAPGPLIYIATAQPLDDEMARRIADHRARRGARWRTVEAPLDLPQAIEEHAAPEGVVLIDCLTLWLSNLMHMGMDAAAAAKRLLAALDAARGAVIVVSNEVGLGVVPETRLGREFRDHAGRLNQAVAGAADRVLFMVAGLPMQLKPPSAGA